MTLLVPRPDLELLQEESLRPPGHIRTRDTAAEFAVKYNHAGLAQIIQCAQRQYGSTPVGANCRQILGFDPREGAKGQASR